MSTSNEITFIDKVKTKENFFCDICKFPLIDYLDFNTSKKYSSCHDCYLQFIESRKKEWQSGWRPNKLTIKNYITKKKSIIIKK